MVKALQAVLVAIIVAFASALAAQETFFKWKNVGADPCNPQVGCTLEWALEQSGWPAHVRSGLMEQVRTVPAQSYRMESGWTGWMTWGEKQRKFRSNTIADWPADQTEISDHWYFDDEETDLRYNLVQVHKCKNWGGWTSEYVPPPPVPPARSPLGVLPRVSCI